MRRIGFGIVFTLFFISVLTLVRASSGGNIDVYTQHGGQGPNEPSEAFTPQDEVILFALVTYNDWPEQNKFVTFDVYDPNGGRAIYFDTTDGDGVASTSFTIPAPGVDPFGTWEITATVDVAGKSCKDTLKFEVCACPRDWNPADVNYDLKVDIYDVVLVCIAYGSTPSDSNWNCYCDIAEPYGVIDINDMVLTCVNYGEECNP